MKIENQLWI